MKIRLPKLDVLLWSALAPIALSANASAYCVGWDKTLPNYDPRFYSISHELRRAKYVIKGRVVRETWIGEDGKKKSLQPPFQFGGPKPWGFDPYVGAYYDIQVEASFKGNPPPMLRLFSENSTARFWFDVGSEQVLFVTDENFDQPIGPSLTVDTCGNSKPLVKARELLRSLKMSRGPG